MSARLSYSLIRTIARCLLALLLFTQMVVAAHACGEDVHEGGQTPAPTTQGPKHQSCHGMDDMVLEQAQPSAPAEQGQSNLCSVHCAGNAQSADTYQVPAPVMPSSPVLTILLPTDGTATTQILASDAGLARPLPIPILFGVLRC